MPDISNIIAHGVSNPWLYLPVAVLLGALHALEPGHAKSLMAAFIIAIRGTARQAILLGVSAAVGHTIVVWGLAAIGLYMGDKLILESAEPWLATVAGIMVVLLALRLLISVRRKGEHDHEHSHSHSHDGHHAHARSSDDHALQHAHEIEKNFANRSSISALEVAWFGFTGGLMPCPSALAVLFVCLQLKAFTLGMGMVAAFSFGLAVTLVSIGLLAAWGTKRAAGSWSGFEKWANILPLISGALVMVLGLILTLRGLSELGVFTP